VTPPSLALVVFRLILPKAPRDDAELNLLNQRLNTNLGARYDVMVTQTMLHSKERDVFCIRFAIGGVSTEMKDVETTWRIIESEGERVLEGWGKD
jgi:aromatic-L-amino-acid decarboxylase